jgi:hypothetical protein
MSQKRIEVSAVIDAQPEEIYVVIADYRNGHPRIMPEEYLRGLEVEAGGYGAGTIIRFRVHSFGMDHPARSIISEPESGRVLVETEMMTNIITTYTLTPLSDGKTRLQIASEWQISRNPFVALQQALYPRLMRAMDAKELELISAFMSGKKTREDVSSQP